MTPEEYLLMKKRAEQEDAPKDMVPIADPLDFLPLGGMKAAFKLGKAGAQEGAELAGNALAKTGALNKLKGLFGSGIKGSEQISAPATQKSLGELINPDIAKMQLGGKISPELAGRMNGLQGEINDLSHVNQFDAAREAEIKAANSADNVIPMNSVTNTEEITKPIDVTDSLKFNKLKKMMGGR